MTAASSCAGSRPHGKITSDWTPTSSGVIDLEGSLRRYLKHAAPQLEARLAECRRQYTGFYHVGKRLMFVNFACDGPRSSEWRCRPVVVDDGGDCFFNLRCEPKTNLWDGRPGPQLKTTLARQNSTAGLNKAPTARYTHPQGRFVDGNHAVSGRASAV